MDLPWDLIEFHLFLYNLARCHSKPVHMQTTPGVYMHEKQNKNKNTPIQRFYVVFPEKCLLTKINGKFIYYYKTTLLEGDDFWHLNM